MFEGIFGVVTRKKFFSEPFPQGFTEFIDVNNQVASEALKKVCPTLRRD